MGNNMIKSISFVNLKNWNAKHINVVMFDYKGKPVVRLGDVLKRSKIPITIQKDDYYKRIMVRQDNRGVVLRDEVKGKDIGTIRQSLVKAGQFLVSRIDAMNGAFGIVPQELDGAIITDNFWAFDVDCRKINLHFLPIMLNTRYFLNLLNENSIGAAMRHVREETFLNILIPILDLKEQSDIVNKIEDSKRLVEEAEKIKQKVLKECEDVIFHSGGLE